MVKSNGVVFLKFSGNYVVSCDFEIMNKKENQPMNGIGAIHGVGNKIHPLGVNFRPAPIYVSPSSDESSDYEDSNTIKFENVFKTRVYMGNGSVVNSDSRRNEGSDNYERSLVTSGSNVSETRSSKTSTSSTSSPTSTTSSSSSSQTSANDRVSISSHSINSDNRDRHNKRRKKRRKSVETILSDTDDGDSVSSNEILQVINEESKRNHNNKGIMRKPTFGEQLQHRRHNYSNYEGASNVLKNRPVGPTWQMRWKRRCKACTILTSGSMVILSGFSLLFIVPLIVDPILVGFEARFSQTPVSCRSLGYVNGSGPAQCTRPSCREGCTVDLYSCFFVYVQYEMPYENSSMISNASLSFENTIIRNATLHVNINGCGYPPRVTCSDFFDQYATQDAVFPCFYSQQNSSIVVPSYEKRREVLNLIWALVLPFGTLFGSVFCLCSLTCKWNPCARRRRFKKKDPRKLVLNVVKFVKLAGINLHQQSVTPVNSQNAQGTDSKAAINNITLVHMSPKNERANSSSVVQSQQNNRKDSQTKHAKTKHRRSGESKTDEKSDVKRPSKSSKKPRYIKRKKK